MTENEIRTLNGVCKSLDGLRSIMEGLPDTTDNADLWEAIGEAGAIANRIVRRNRRL